LFSFQKSVHQAPINKRYQYPVQTIKSFVPPPLTRSSRSLPRAQWKSIFLPRGQSPEAIALMKIGP
jgi:hypothetical protein